MRPETMTGIGGREHIIMIGMRTVLSRGVMVFELNGRKELSDLTGMTDAREALMRIVQITRSIKNIKADVREDLMRIDQITGSIKNIKADVREALMRIDQITRSIKNTRADVRGDLMRIDQNTRITKTTRVEI
jgi:virulence-associated protein VapD